jgi:two-component system cell cycle sensor histidine kinase/response regulator CckA
VNQRDSGTEARFAGNAMKQILIVDDDASVLSLVASALADYSLSRAYCGADALATAISTGPLDLLITDFMMPSMQGDELIGRLRQVQPDLKVLVLSGHTDILDAENLPWWNAERHLTKPFGIVALRSAVTEMIGPP